MKTHKICRDCYNKNLEKTLNDIAKGGWKTGTFVK